ncbi:hypothetical protein [Amycolatopsis jiangsuensis]|uniref:Uncharacterized protein n=1 Tax=Amycolatopsis jiangsuensis TaxID=1181879 RepID=A0A840IUB6_9PSEU|nr:hypothetical protein [Amycolatopsis jiangsuensis]MBB4684748.1 hypothetical protein [Amycolatopsis jiangsuensis]
MGLRPRRWLAPVLVLALGAGAGPAFLVVSAIRVPAPPGDRTPVPLAGHRGAPLCRCTSRTTGRCAGARGT